MKKLNYRILLCEEGEYLALKELLSDEQKLADYLDYLHMQKVKKQSKKRISLEHVKKELAIG